jgi:negative regulator of sigma E activity
MSLVGDIRLPSQPALLKRRTDPESELEIGKVSDLFSGVEVLGTRNHSICAVVVSSPVDTRHCELVHIDHDMGIEIVESALDVTRLLLEQLRVVAVGVDVACKFTLEVVDSVCVVTGQNEDVHPFQQMRGPCAVCIHFAQ